MSWNVFDYESDMFEKTLRLCATDRRRTYPHPIPNALAESPLLHTRVLAEILLSRDSEPDAVRLNRLLPDFTSQRVDELRVLYGDRKTSGTPCWTLNKMLAHATSARSDSYDYSAMVGKLAPCMQALIAEVQRAREGRSQPPTANFVITYNASTRSS
jgi:hypothetical protein